MSGHDQIDVGESLLGGLEHLLPAGAAVGPSGLEAPPALGPGRAFPANLGRQPLDGDAAEVAAEGEQLCVGAALQPHEPERLRFGQRSAELMSHARAALARKTAAGKVSRLESKVTSNTAALDTIVRSMPLAGKLLGKATSASAVGRKKKGLKPSDLKIVCRGMHLPSKLGVNLGVKQKRLIAAGSKLMLLRQKLAFKGLLARSRQALRPQPSERAVHLSFAHLWDEVNARFRFTRKRKFHQSKMAVNVQTIVQRGTVLMALMDLQHQRTTHFHEQWLCQPRQVAGTSAEALYPGIISAMPESLVLESKAAVKETAEAVSSATLMFVGDVASGNVLLMKGLVQQWERLPAELRKKVLVMCETCGIHMHHRAKLRLPALRPHTMRHFSIAHLHRLQSVQDQMLRFLEMLIQRRVKRRVGPPPIEPKGSLRSFVDIVFRPEANFHKRSGPKAQTSQQSRDLEALCSMVNGDLCSAEWTHHCWESVGRRPCCESQADAAEKTCVAVVNALFGKTDPIPAESRWTNTLSNFQRTLLRRAVYKVGLQCFHIDAARAEREFNADSEAAGEYHQQLKATRLSRTAEYYGNDKNMYELAVLSNVIRVFDSTLLYPLLGDAGGESGGDGPSKLELLLNKDGSLIGSCLQQLLQLLDDWIGPNRRDPWGILDILQAPIDNQELMRFARTQILQMATATASRYEIRFSTWPYLLWRLCDPTFTEPEKDAVAQLLVDAPREQLDSYSFGLRCRFPSARELRSLQCVAQLKADFANHPYGTDQIERLNAEFTAVHPRRAPGRLFTNAARESVLRQALCVHRSNGGDNPMAPPSIVAAQSQERVQACPLLPPASAFAACADAALSEQPLPSQVPLPPPSTAPPTPTPTASARGGVATTASVSEGGMHAGVVARSAFGEPLFVHRQRTAPIATEPEPPQSSQSARRGLSPFLLQRNRFMRSVKASKGRTLTDEEIKNAHADFKDRWDIVADRGQFAEEYEEWRHSEPAQAASPTKSYRCMWGGGCVDAPVSCEELFDFLSKYGWPKDDEVLDPDATEGSVVPMSAEKFAAASECKVWGLGRAAKNVDRTVVEPSGRFEIVEAGLHNFLDSAGQEAANSGELLLMIEGTPVLPATEKRLLVMVTGVVGKPKVFQCIRFKFADESNCASEARHLPCDVWVCERPSRVSGAFIVADFMTSDELVLHLTTKLSAIDLWSLTYRIPIEEYGSLRYSRVTGMHRVGSLWDEGMRKPLLGEEIAERRRQRRELQSGLRTSDPLVTAAPSRRCVRPTGAAPTSSGKRAPGRGRTEDDRAEGVHVEHPTIANQVLPEGADDPADDFVDAIAAALGLPTTNANDALREELLDFDAGSEAASLGESDAEELAATYGDAPYLAASSGDGVGCAALELARDVPDSNLVQALAAGISELVAGSEVEERDVERGASSSAEPPMLAPLAPLAPTEEQPWARLSAVSPTGYVYDGMRSVLRIQRGKPNDRSVTINCYRHPGCRLLVSTAKCNDDEQVKRWFCEVPDMPDNASASERKAAAKRHIELGKAMWSTSK